MPLEARKDKKEGKRNSIHSHACCKLCKQFELAEQFLTRIFSSGIGYSLKWAPSYWQNVAEAASAMLTKTYIPQQSCWVYSYSAAPQKEVHSTTELRQNEYYFCTPLVVLKFSQPYTDLTSYS